LGAWDLVATFPGVGLAVAVLAGGGGGGALDTTGAGVGTFWEGAEGLVCQMCSRQSLSNMLVIDYVVGHLT